MTARLRERLTRRLRKGGRHITLTYARDQWDDAEQLYDAAGDAGERHVRRFIARLEQYLGYSLKGRWFRKMEFQSGGWLHWHLLLDVQHDIRHDDLSRLWGHGHVFITRANRKALDYVCKYVAKDVDSLPVWLQARPVRSVRIIAVSPGFWANEAAEESEGEVGEDEDGPPRSDFAERPGGRWSPRLPIYRTIAHAFRVRRDVVYVEEFAIGDKPDQIRHWWKRLRLSVGDVIRACHACGAKVVERDGGWLGIVCADADAVWSVLEDAARAAQAAPPRPPLHSTERSQPPTSVFDRSVFSPEYWLHVGGLVEERVAA